MSKDYAIEFYSSTAWKICRENYKKKMCYICERCGEIATEVHHIQPITQKNIDNPEVTLNEANLMCVCHKCHMRIHHSHDKHGNRYIIDPDGHVIIIE